jgi:hypothetical protein
MVRPVIGINTGLPVKNSAQDRSTKKIQRIFDFKFVPELELRGRQIHRHRGLFGPIKDRQCGSTGFVSVRSHNNFIIYRPASKKYIVRIKCREAVISILRSKQRIKYKIVRDGRCAIQKEATNDIIINELPILTSRAVSKTRLSPIGGVVLDQTVFSAAAAA